MSQIEANLIIILLVTLIIIFVYARKTDRTNGCTVGSGSNGLNKATQTANQTADRESDAHSRESDTHARQDDYENFVPLSKKSKKKNKQKLYHDAIGIINNSRKRPNNLDQHETIHNQTSEPMVNSDFVEIQYHKDYNDTITAINDLTPNKEMFNHGFLPVRESDPDMQNINELVELFMGMLNQDVQNNVSEYLHTNSGWNDMGKRKRIKSGFEEQMEELGLPGSLYNEPASKAPVNLIKIDKAEQYNTDDQIRFIAYIVVQKENVKDQMVLKVQFFLEREDLRSGGDHRAQFFDKKMDENGKLLTGQDAVPDLDPIKNVVIEQVFILGYLTNESKPKSKMDRFHDYKNIQRTDGTTDQEQVLKIMLKKHKERADELNSFMCTVDDETKQLHDVPNIDNYSVYKNTRTIMNDLAKFPQRSFGEISI
jgi:hypothetical protein